MASIMILEEYIIAPNNAKIVISLVVSFTIILP